MIYRSNLEAPDLHPAFAQTTVCGPRHWSMGHDVVSDAKFDPTCGFWTHDEAAILYNVALRCQGPWVDIGSRTGWTLRHIQRACPNDNHVAVDQAYADRLFMLRAVRDVREPWNADAIATSSAEFFANTDRIFAGFCIDGCHDAPEPMRDASGAYGLLEKTGVIIFHDFWGEPIRDGVRLLQALGMKCRIYNTPAGVALCWHGDFTPPDHTPDPAIDWRQVRISRAPEFDYGACV